MDAPRFDTTKRNYIPAPALFKLEQCCQIINAAFDGNPAQDLGCFLVGSALERPDWRDVDIRFNMSETEFAAAFPKAHDRPGYWQFDPKWLLLTIVLSAWLKEQTGLPIDFQFNPQSYADVHSKSGYAMGWSAARLAE